MYSILYVIFQPKEKGNKRPHHLANVGSALKFLTTKNVSDVGDSLICFFFCMYIFIVTAPNGLERVIFEQSCNKLCDMLINCVHYLQVRFDFTHQVKLVNIHRESVVDGNQTLVLGLIWAIIHHYQVN